MKTRTEGFEHGQRVKYIPRHARGRADHPDCQTGVVYSVGKEVVLVKYDNLECIMVTGDEPYTAQATPPEHLIIIDEERKLTINISRAVARGTKKCDG